MYMWVILFLFSLQDTKGSIIKYLLSKKGTGMLGYVRVLKMKRTAFIIRKKKRTLSLTGLKPLI